MVCFTYMQIAVRVPEGPRIFADILKAHLLDVVRAAELDTAAVLCVTASVRELPHTASELLTCLIACRALV